MKNLNVLSDDGIVIKKIVVHRLVAKLKETLNFKLENLLIVFVNSNSILKINKQYLKHNYTTDIITFNYSKESNMFDGEIYISVLDAQNNAKRYNVTLNSEIIRLIIHGILHLLGYDDIDRKDKLVMKKMENLLVDKLYNFDKNNIIHV